MRNSLRLIVVVSMAAMAAAGLTYCGGGGGGDSKETCPGITCNNCSGSGNCSLSCSAGRTQVCTAHPENSNLRCAYCR